MFVGVQEVSRCAVPFSPSRLSRPPAYVVQSPAVLPDRRGADLPVRLQRGVGEPAPQGRERVRGSDPDVALRTGTALGGAQLSIRPVYPQSVVESFGLIRPCYGPDRMYSSKFDRISSATRRRASVAEGCLSRSKRNVVQWPATEIARPGNNASPQPENTRPGKNFSPQTENARPGLPIARTVPS